MKTRRIAGVSVVVTIAAFGTGIVRAQDSPVVPELKAPALTEFYEKKWMEFQLSAHGSHLNDLIQSLGELRANPPQDETGREEWQRLLSDFQDTSDQFLSLNQAFSSQTGQPAEPAAAQE